VTAASRQKSEVFMIDYMYDKLTSDLQFPKYDTKNQFLEEQELRKLVYNACIDVFEFEAFSRALVSILDKCMVGERFEPISEYDCGFNSVYAKTPYPVNFVIMRYRDENLSGKGYYVSVFYLNVHIIIDTLHHCFWIIRAGCSNRYSLPAELCQRLEADLCLYQYEYDLEKYGFGIYDPKE